MEHTKGCCLVWWSLRCNSLTSELPTVTGRLLMARPNTHTHTSTHTSIHYDMHVEYVVCHVLVMTTPRPSVSAIFLLFVGVLIGVLLPLFFSFLFLHTAYSYFANLPRALVASPICWHFINWKKCSTKPLLRLKQLFSHSPSDKSIKTLVQQNEVNEKDKR